MYLLDTNICIYIVNKHPLKIMERIKNLNPQEIKISSITVAEMEYGASKSESREMNRSALKRFLSSFEIINFDTMDAEIYGMIRAELERNGNVIGPYDMQLAAQALRWDCIFVTNNIKEFQRINRLKLENWI
ncbi:MAG: type II toxin-antitoxin system VapC family toxin [Dysgonamonadaceae bacterium]|jgi:tRNA(fMet)-specific endonuclease VapC|nr:type II toxin-antitoxin system VapC family toxin [Dysgonamonadaceae bacterium]